MYLGIYIYIHDYHDHIGGFTKICNKLLKSTLLYWVSLRGKSRILVIHVVGICCATKGMIGDGTRPFTPVCFPGVLGW